MEYTGGYVPLGNSGIQVSRLAFGCGFRAAPGLAAAQRAIEDAMDRGINFFDCANKYETGDGPSEVALGRAIRGRRDRVVITSKVGAQTGRTPPGTAGGSRGQILAEAERSLKNLGTDYIDLYLLHFPDEKTPVEETCRALEDLRRQGKVRYLGLCNHSARQAADFLAAQERAGARPLAAVQNAYNLLNRAPEEALFPLCRQREIAVMAYSPLAAGLLGGAVRGDIPPDASTLWGSDPLYREYHRRIFPGPAAGAVEAVRRVAANRGVPMARVASAWALTHPQVTCVVTGANNPGELADSLAALSLTLEEDELAMLEQASRGLSIRLDKTTVTKMRENGWDEFKN